MPIGRRSADVASDFAGVSVSGAGATSAILPSASGPFGPPIVTALLGTVPIVTGKGLLQSDDELAARNDALSGALSELAARYLSTDHGKALDVGCQQGALMTMMDGAGDFSWVGVDPNVDQPMTSPAGQQMLHGWAHELPFEDESFELVLLANVYEHIDPLQRDASLREIRRVLKRGGILVGQLPNPYFPVESHSRLPFMGYLPPSLRRRYWRFTPVHWEMDFHSVTSRD